MAMFTIKDLIEFLESLKPIVIEKLGETESRKLDLIIDRLKFNKPTKDNKDSIDMVLSFLMKFGKEIFKHKALELIIRAIEESLK